MDHGLSRSGRATALLALLLHLMVGVGGPLLDGTLEAAASEPPVHIEARGSKSCVPVHDHLSCQICRVVGRDILALVPVVPDLPTGAAVRVAAPAPAPWNPSSAFDAALGPRAPPRAS